MKAVTERKYNGTPKKAMLGILTASDFESGQRASAEMLEARDRALAYVPTPNQHQLGDPPPGRSALENRKLEEPQRERFRFDTWFSKEDSAYSKAARSGGLALKLKARRNRV
jgi:hypothetical protein